eukprot:CCRYP_017193-RA/>CCRYP_017193-RA protein AED:0.27 eAED:0.27 QI:95/1/0.5/1/0/0/2/0/67
MEECLNPLLQKLMTIPKYIIKTSSLTNPFPPLTISPTQTSRTPKAQTPHNHKSTPPPSEYPSPHKTS